MSLFGLSATVFFPDRQLLKIQQLKIIRILSIVKKSLSLIVIGIPLNHNKVYWIKYEILINTNNNLMVSDQHIGGHRPTNSHVWPLVINIHIIHNDIVIFLNLLLDVDVRTYSFFFTRFPFPLLKHDFFYQTYYQINS